MRTLQLPVGQMMKYVFTGKFVAPSEDWKHEIFPLQEYELFVMTEGMLYLSYDRDNFTVSSGQYLLLPPSNSWRKGFKSAYCAFYWLHFSVMEPEHPPPQPKSDFFTIPQTGTVPKLEKMVVLMKQLQDSVKNRYPAMALDAMTTCVVTELYGQLIRQNPMDVLIPAQKQIYSDIVDYIKLHLSENIRVSDIATHFGYNSKYLSHLFAEITGSPLKQLL